MAKRKQTDNRAVFAAENRDVVGSESNQSRDEQTENTDAVEETDESNQSSPDLKPGRIEVLPPLFIQKQCEPSDVAETCNKLESDGYVFVSLFLMHGGTAVGILARTK